MSLVTHSEREPGSVELRYDPSAHGRLQCAPQVIDHGLALAHLSLRRLAGERYALLGESQPDRPAGSMRSCTLLRRADPHCPAVRRAAPVAGDAQCAGARGAAHDAAPDAAVASAVRRALAHSLAQARLDRTTIARMLGLHPRTLQRRLDAEGTSFDALRDEVRREATLRYLHDTGYPIAEVAGLVGFSEQSAFTRYCRSKLGGTPTEIRARR